VITGQPDAEPGGTKSGTTASAAEPAGPAGAPQTASPLLRLR
jgi:hypothetical protein